MPLHSGRGLAPQAADNCFVHTKVTADGAELPVALVGLVHRQATRGRPDPPACISGFDTAYTPFALGHIMALELGGWDAVANIVPQYGMWQGLQTGDWRRMELAIGASAAEVMIVKLEYAAVADTYVTQAARFRAGDKLFHWSDPRIPVTFRVWTKTAVSVRTYFDAAADGKKAALDALALGAPDYEFPILTMPHVDRGYWRAQMINARARAAHAEYQRNPGPPLPTGGPVRHAATSHRYDPIGRRGAPVAAALPFHRWIAQESVLRTIADEFQNDTNGVALGFSLAERNTVSDVTVSTAVFQA